eukprot:TRINITY_DN115925_c0_g1_i1.p2 TRINITY_DN115925_c0_g1~~TRINITY_DN115925_c0_g1_i1.p2  ORF type:complete len:102 (+),score=16.16 TRINITY_DN115925_c0_g1_i1:62-367(+)
MMCLHPSASWRAHRQRRGAWKVMLAIATFVSAMSFAMHADASAFLAQHRHNTVQRNALVVGGRHGVFTSPARQLTGCKAKKASAWDGITQPWRWQSPPVGA